MPVWADMCWCFFNIYPCPENNALLKDQIYVRAWIFYLFYSLGSIYNYQNLFLEILFVDY